MNLKGLFLLLITITIVQCKLDCTPFGTRLSFGQVYHDLSSNQKLVISFNTHASCNRSYIQIQTNDSAIFKQYCRTTPIHLQLKSESHPSQNFSHDTVHDTYQTFVHDCFIYEIQFQLQFSYNVYGFDDQSSPIPFSNSYIRTKILNPTKYQKQAKFIFLADWGKIYSNNYKPLADSFKKLIENGIKIDGLIINGDFGYDLQTRHCLNYEDYLIMASQVSQIWPTIYITGNHEYISANNFQLFAKSFVLHDLESKLVTKYNLGQFNLIVFDPYDLIYNKKVQSHLRVDRSGPAELLSDFKMNLQNLRTSEKPTIVVSHYPLKCTGYSEQCENDTILLQNFFDLVFENRVGFYIGAHHHTYQRNYPYLRNKTFIKKQPPYSPQMYGQLINIVEGVAGNNNGIVESYGKMNKQSAFHTQNETGFGILSVNFQLYNYKHFSTEQTLSLRDQINITLYPYKKFQVKPQIMFAQE